jgi:hypothetical protein
MLSAVAVGFVLVPIIFFIILLVVAVVMRPTGRLVSPTLFKLIVVVFYGLVGGILAAWSCNHKASYGDVLAEHILVMVVDAEAKELHAGGTLFLKEWKQRSIGEQKCNEDSRGNHPAQERAARPPPARIARVKELL